MSASQHDGPDDDESGRVAAEQSETRMRQALDRLSGDRLGGERQGGDRAVFDRQGDRAVFDRQGGERTGPDRAPPDRLGVERPVLDRTGLDRAGGGNRAQTAAKSPIALKASFSSAGPRRHRYVQDGEVPVVQVSSLRDRRREPAIVAPAAHEQPADAVRQMLAQERAGRVRAEQALERLQATLHAVETRLGHAEITRREAAEQASRHEANATRLQAELLEQTAAAQAARLQANAALERQRDLERQLDAAQSSFDVSNVEVPIEVPPPLLRRVNAKPAAVRAAARAATPELPLSDPDEPEPVKWWLTPVSKSKARRGG